MTDEVLFRTNNRAGIVSLNKPRTIHALTQGMIDAMLSQLTAWASDPAVEVILLDHHVAPDADAKSVRGFCSGGDVNLVRTSVLEDGGAAGRHFFHEEYRLNNLMFGYAKPIVAFMDGITMGGGVGISQPARYRVATENTRFAMPETAIGLIPDVGGGWYLSRLAGRVGRWLAITGARLDGADCLAVGLATHYIVSADLAAVKAEIAANPADVERILAVHAAPAPAAPVAAHRADIDRLFASNRLEDVLAALEADGGAWATDTAATLRTKSPLSCKVSLRQLAEGAKVASFSDNMAMEYRLAARIIAQPDFVEGVRAVLVDKDHAPKWDPATPEGATDERVAALFAPLPADEEWRP